MRAATDASRMVEQMRAATDASRIIALRDNMISMTEIRAEVNRLGERLPPTSN